jgi:hypothetical protein
MIIDLLKLAIDSVDLHLEIGGLIHALELITRVQILRTGDIRV